MLFKISNNQNYIIHLFQSISIIGFLLYFFGLTNMYFWLGLTIVYLFTCTRVESGIFFLLVGSGIFGRMFASQQLYISFIIVSLLIGIYFLYKEIVYYINKNTYTYVFLFLIIFFYLFYYLLGPQTDYANEKIIKTISRGLIWTTTFIIFSQSQDVSSKRISLPFLFLTIFYLSQSAELYNVRPSSIDDITYFRTFCSLIGRNENQTLIVNYHTLAYLIIAYLVFWFSEKDFYKKDIWGSIFTLIITFWILILSGTRQTIISFAAIMLIRYLIKEKNIISVKNIVVLSIYILFFVFFIRMLGSAFFEDTFSSDAAWNDRIHRDTSTPYKVMSINPLTGVGFGAYGLYDSRHEYPHNFFLELLCETGLIGFSIYLMIIGLFFYLNKFNLKLYFCTKCGAYLAPLFVLFFLRSMISGDFSDSMSFISILFCFVATNINDIGIIDNEEISESSI